MPAQVCHALLRPCAQLLPPAVLEEGLGGEASLTAKAWEGSAWADIRATGSPPAGQCLSGARKRLFAEQR